jgi:hypothetical protein
MHAIRFDQDAVAWEKGDGIVLKKIPDASGQDDSVFEFRMPMGWKAFINVMRENASPDFERKQGVPVRNNFTGIRIDRKRKFLFHNFGAIFL